MESVALVSSVGLVLLLIHWFQGQTSKRNSIKKYMYQVIWQSVLIGQSIHTFITHSTHYRDRPSLLLIVSHCFGYFEYQT